MNKNLAPSRLRSSNIFSSCLFMLFILYGFSSFSQTSDCPKSENKKAIALLEQASHQAKTGTSLATIRQTIDKALAEDPEFIDAYLLLGDVAMQKGVWKEMENNYLKVVTACPDLSPKAWYYLGRYYFDNQKYDDAVKYLKGFLKFEKKSTLPDQKMDSLYTQSDSVLSLAKFYAEAFKNPVPFDPKPIPNVCTNEDEYLPLLSPDNDYLYFIRKYQKQKMGDLIPTLVEDFTLSKRTNGIFDKGTPMPRPFNLYNNQGAATISIDNKHLFLTICKPAKRGVMNCDIYTSDYENDQWSEIRNMGPVVNDSVQWDSQPSLSPDGKILYFASIRDGGIGGIDLYKTVKDSNGVWGKPINLGSNINTSGNEKSPFIHPDGKTLYFSSTGWSGMGGYDIFYSKMDDKGNWGKPKNIGYPINSPDDDLGFIVSTDGKIGYYASNKLHGNGGYDVYYFDLYPEARPDKVLFVKGDLKEKGSDQHLNARVELKNVDTKEVVEVPVDSVTGKFVSVVRFNGDYIMTVKKQGYAFTSQYFSQKDSLLEKPSTVELKLDKVEIGKSYKLNDIYFETNSFELNTTSKQVIDDFVDFLTENPSVKVSINGHTDNVGDPGSNQILSENRAKAVYEYIIQNGIFAGRLSYKGYGESSPVAVNTTDAGRAQNRRTEFFILEK